MGLAVEIRRKFVLAILAFLGLGILSWVTLSNEPIAIRDSVFGFDVHIQFRTATLAVLGLFAGLSTLSFLRALTEERRQSGSGQS
jgi:hypothetical protein